MKLNLNDPEFIKSLVDYYWMYCFNADCPRAAECIRFISAKFKPDDVTAGNAVYPDANLHASCSHFMRVYQFKAAWGFSHLYDQVKHVEMQTIKYRVMDVLGNRTSYYRVHRGEKHLTPEMQEQVKQVFAEYGYFPQNGPISHRYLISFLTIFARCTSKLLLEAG